MAMSAWGTVLRVSIATFILGLLRKLLSRSKRRAIKDASSAVSVKSSFVSELRIQPALKAQSSPQSTSSQASGSQASTAEPGPSSETTEFGPSSEQLCTPPPRPKKKEKQKLSGKKVDGRVSSRKVGALGSHPSSEPIGTASGEHKETSLSSAKSSAVPSRKFSIRIGQPRKEEQRRYVEFPVIIAEAGGATLETRWRRYSDFVEFHKEASPGKQFPGKKMFGSTDPAFLEQRRAGLERYLQQILAVDPSCRSPQLQRFLGWRPPPPEVNQTQPEAALESEAIAHRGALPEAGRHSEDAMEEYEEAGAEEDEEASEDEDEEDEGEEQEKDEDEAGAANDEEPSPIVDAAQKLAVDDFAAALRPAHIQINEMLQEGFLEQLTQGPPAIYLKKGTAAGIICSKQVGEIPAPVDAVLNCLKDPARKGEYDPEFQCEDTLAELDTSPISAALGLDAIFCGIRHTQSASPMPSLMAARDTVMAICRTRNADGSIMIAATSVEHPDAPELTTHTRARVLAVGLILKPLDQNRTLFTKVAHIDVNGKVPTNWMLRRMLPKKSTNEFVLLSKACCDRARWPEELLA